LITHDIGVHANLADRIAVLYAGKVVEEGETRMILKEPRHPYTQHLINSLPRLDERSEREGIPGRPPALDDPPTGCRFHPRCPLALEICRTTDPETISVQPGHLVACHAVANEVSHVAVH
jgi:peptide/nickel transport system ATP-binding protein